MNVQKLTCFAHRHMTLAEYGLYSHLREVSHGSKQQYTYKFDDRTLAERFAHTRGCSKDSVNRLRQSLAKKGFISWLEPQKRVGGRYAQRLGRILSHAEWAERYPGTCIHSVLENCGSPVATTALHQSQAAEHQSRVQAHQSQIQPSPVSDKGANQSHERDISIHKNKSINTNPLSNGMVPSQNLKEETLSLSNSANPKSHSDAGLSNATGGVSPVSETRQMNEMDKAVASIMSDLGVTGRLIANSWRKAVEQLSTSDCDPALVAEVLRFYIAERGISHVKAERPEDFAVSFPMLLKGWTDKCIQELWGNNPKLEGTELEGSL